MGSPRGVGAIRGLSGHQGVGVRGVLGAGRKCRYSGARRSIGSIKGHWGSPRGVAGCRGCQGV